MTHLMFGIEDVCIRLFCAEGYPPYILFRKLVAIHAIQLPVRVLLKLLKILLQVADRADQG